MNQEAALKLLAKHGTKTDAARACGMNRSTFSRLCRKDGPKSATTAADLHDPDHVHGGILLRNVRVSTVRPSGDGIKAMLYRLPKGKAFPIKALAEKWSKSEDTVTKHVRRCDCHLYVETSPGMWESCAVHPDTAAEHSREG